MSDLFASPNNIKLLGELIYPKKGDESSDDEEHVTKKATNTYFSPADIAKKQKADTLVDKQADDRKEKKSPYEKIEKETPKTDLDYENELESKVHELTEESTWKAKPEWDVSYRQAVNASDVFLQMGNKTNATSSCENLIIKIKLPGDIGSSIDLKCFEHEVILNSSKYYTKIPLPHPIDPKYGNAHFYDETETLVVTLLMKREFDFVNF